MSKTKRTTRRKPADPLGEVALALARCLDAKLTALKAEVAYYGALRKLKR